MSRATTQHRILAGLAGLLVLASVSGCTSGSASQTAQPTVQPQQAEERTNQKAPGSDANNLAPAFQLSDVHTGQPISHVLGKPTVIFFMASWCSSCIGEEDALKQVWAKYGDKVQLLTVDVDTVNDTAENLKQFAKEYGGDWPHALDSDQMVQKFAISSLDTTVIIGADGKTVYRDERPTPFLLLDRALSPLLTKS